MTSAGVENLEFDTEQRRRSAHVLPKLPPAVESTPKTAQDVGQEAGPVAENDGQVGFGAIMLRKMADVGCRPSPMGKSAIISLERTRTILNARIHNPPNPRSNSMKLATATALLAVLFAFKSTPSLADDKPTGPILFD